MSCAMQAGPGGNALMNGPQAFITNHQRARHVQNHHAYLTGVWASMLLQ
jgi:hypothetical protein